MGVSEVRIGPEVLLEETDAEAMKEGQEITLLRWGNVKIIEVERDEAGQVRGLKGEFVPNVEMRVGSDA